jgi:hypothetical protein
MGSERNRLKRNLRIVFGLSMVFWLRIVPVRALRIISRSARAADLKKKKKKKKKKIKIIFLTLLHMQMKSNNAFRTWQGQIDHCNGSN